MFWKALILSGTALWLAGCNEPGSNAPIGPGIDSTSHLDTTGNLDTLPPVVPMLIGDFAPLRVGNVWKYSGSKSSRAGTCNGGVYNETLLRTMTILNKAQISDTAFYFLEIKDSITGGLGAFYNPNRVSIGMDTVMEYSDGAIAANNRFPFFSAHLKMDTLVKEEATVSGNNYPAYSETRSATSSEYNTNYRSRFSVTFAQNLGLVKYDSSYYRQANSCNASSESYSLIEFILGAL